MRAFLISLLMFVLLITGCISVDYQYKNTYFTKGSDRGCLDQPHDIAISPRGKIAIADSKNHRISIMDSNGRLETLIGKKGTRKDELYFPKGICYDKYGSLFIADSMNSRVVRYDSAGNVEKVYEIVNEEDPANKDNALKDPLDVFVTEDGKVFVTDTGNSRICVFSDSGKLIDTFGKKGSGPGELKMPTSIYIDKDGFIFITDQINSKILKLDKSYTLVKEKKIIIDGVGPLPPFRICSDPQDKDLYVIGMGTYNAYSLDKDLEFKSLISRFGNEPESCNLNYPRGLAVSREGKLYIAEYIRSNVLVFQKKK